MTAGFSFAAAARVPAAIALLSVLGSCTGLRPQLDRQPPDWQDRLDFNRGLQIWQLQGRIGIQGETEGGSFDLFWDQSSGGYRIRLLAPLGQGAVMIEGGEAGVLVRTADGEAYSDSDADRLFARITGIELPLAGLKDWVRGMPMQRLEAEHISWNEQGQLYRLSQDGWNVEMNRYLVVDGYELPHKFYIEREDSPELAIRVLIRSWRPGG